MHHVRLMILPLVAACAASRPHQGPLKALADSVIPPLARVHCVELNWDSLQPPLRYGHPPYRGCSGEPRDTLVVLFLDQGHRVLALQRLLIPGAELRDSIYRNLVAGVTRTAGPPTACPQGPVLGVTDQRFWDLPGEAGHLSLSRVENDKVMWERELGPGYCVQP